MRKLFGILLSLVLLSSLVAAQPYVTVFEGRITTGQTLAVGNYTITVVQAADGSHYLMLRNGSRILELKPFAFGTEIERDGLKILLGSYTPQGGFVVVSVKPDFITSLKPEVGAKASFNGNVVEVTAVGNKTVDVSVNGVARTLEVNGSAVVDLIALEYDGKEIKVYAASPVSETLSLNYVVFYPYGKIRVSGPVDIPITITSSSNSEMSLNLTVISMPKGWKASFLYGGVEVEEITLPPMGSVTVTLHVEATGSGTVKFSVGSLPGSIEIEARGVEVSIPYLALDVEAGQVLTIPVTFTGSGTVDFEPKDIPAGWNMYLTTGEYRLRSFTVSGTLAASLVIEVPRNATLGNHRLSFIVNGREYGLVINIYKTYLGEPAKLTVILTDESGNPVKGWVSVGGRNVTTSPTGAAALELPSGKYKLVAGAPGAVPKEETIELGDGEEKSIQITLSRAPYYFEAELQNDALTVQAGGSASTEVRITNLGSNEDEYRITLEGLEPGWSYVISQDPSGATPVGTIKVGPGESTSAYLVVIAPFNVVSGGINARVIIEGKRTKVEKTLTVRVENPASLTLNSDYPSLTVKAGGSTATNIWVDAAGTVTNVKFSVQAPAGWDVEVVPDTIPRLGVMERGNVQVYPGPTTVELRIKVPKSAPAGTYTITVTAAGDQAKAETVITVRVTQSSSSAYLGILLLVAVFGIVIWLMRRVGRR
ncbi:NEW3 domain-containing protein [Thermococcus sp.]|uniref:COG1470 family protein n=1 Tax=Thermococcus sp. TaxID=35749 RepID=UPI0025D54C5A|nr:NEW3 domain-containing protein [Thermococcus sp.]